MLLSTQPDPNVNPNGSHSTNSGDMFEHVWSDILENVVMVIYLL